MLFGISPSDAIKLVEFSTRLYVSFKDANDNSEAQVKSLVQEFLTFHHCLVELKDLLREYGKPLPFLYLDFKKTLQQCEKTLKPYVSYLVNYEINIKKFTRLHLEATKQTQRLLDSAPFRSMSFEGHMYSSNTFASISQATLDVLYPPSEVDQLYKDWLIFNHYLKNEDDRLAQEAGILAWPFSLGSTPDLAPSRDAEIAAVFYHLRRELEDAIMIEENRAKRTAVEKRTNLVPSDAVQQEIRNMPTIPHRTYTLETDHADFAEFHNSAISSSTATLQSNPRIPSPSTSLSKIPQIQQAYFGAVDWHSLSPGSNPQLTPSVSTTRTSFSTNPDSRLSVSTAITTPDEHPLHAGFSVVSLATIALGKGALDWNKICRRVDVERTTSKVAERRKCDVHWRYREDFSLSIRSVYRDERTSKPQAWIVQHFPATGPSIPLTIGYPDGGVSIQFPRQSFGNLEKRCTDIKYTFEDQDSCAKLQKLLYTNNGKDAAELLYDRPVLTISSNKNKPECRRSNIRLWEKGEQQPGPNGLLSIKVLVLLFYTSSLPVDGAHWVEEPHYVFQWLDQSEYKKSSDKLVLIFSERSEHWGKDELFKQRKSSQDDHIVVEPVNPMSTVPTLSLKRRLSTMSSAGLTRSNRIETKSLDKTARERQVNSLNRFGYSELEIKFMNKRDRKEFLDVWRVYEKPLGVIQTSPEEPFLYHSQGERSAVAKPWPLDEAKFSDFSRERISQMPSSIIPNSLGDKSANTINPPTQESMLKVESGNDDDIWSVVSETPKDNGELHLSPPNIRPDQWHDEIISGIVIVLVTNDVLTLLYEKALQLVPEDWLVNNFRRLLIAFCNNLADLPKSRVIQQLASLLRSENTQQEIADRVVARQTSPDNPLSQENVARIQGSDESTLSKLERFFTQVQIPPPPPDALRNADVDQDEEVDENSISGVDIHDEEEAPMQSGISRRPRVEQFIRTLALSQPFQDMILGLKELLLPYGLLSDILPIPRDRIKFGVDGKSHLLNRIQGWLEDNTELEWDWWPLAPRMRPLIEGETRVYWRCFCGTVRYSTLKPIQKDILEDVLGQPPAMSRRPLLCVSLYSTAVCTNPQSRPAPASGGQVRSVSIPLSRITPPVAVYSPSMSSSSTSQLGNNPAPFQTSSGASSGPNNNLPTQNNYQQKKPLWFIFKIEGPRSASIWDQFRDDDLGTDRLFQQRLRQRHHQLRGRLRLWFSYWRLSYWEFVKLQKTRPGRIVDRGIDLPMTLDYNYSPRPPKITAKAPWISRHEFEEIVKSCITPCWLKSFPTMLGMHDCACPKEDSKRLVGALLKRDSEFMINDSSESEDYVWGLHARYVVSGLYVFGIHIAILAITLGLWVWWQRKHPNDIQGASVPMTVAGICISTFWASTGILKGLR